MEKNGRHIIIDGEVDSSDVFSHENLENMFKTLVKTLDMQILAGPTFIDVELDESKLQSDVFQDEGGTTGFCVLSTSHASIHTWALRKFFSMDVFSCKDYDTEAALSVIKKFLSPNKISLTNITRSGARKPSVVSTCLILM